MRGIILWQILVHIARNFTQENPMLRPFGASYIVNTVCFNNMNIELT